MSYISDSAVWSSKVMYSFYREKIDEHLKECSFSYDYQYGFTKGGRVENCMYIQNYVANRTFESKRQQNKTLFFIFIDFKKAYDSVDRKKLIEAMIRYKVNPKIIELIVQMYTSDKTIITLGKIK